MRDEVRNVLQHVLRTANPGAEVELGKIGDDENLFNLGLLNSLGVAMLISKMEGMLGVKIDRAKITRSSLSSVSAIVELVGTAPGR
jgi:acyl carrier protein